MPRQIRDAWRWVQQALDEFGRDRATFANRLSTMWFHIDDRLADDVPRRAAGMKSLRDRGG
jgi:hypothetical protein